MTPCTPSGSDATNWQHRFKHRFNALEGLVVQVVVVVSKNSLPLIPLELVSNQKEFPNVHGCTTMSEMKPCGLNKAFGSSAIVKVNTIEPWVSTRNLVGYFFTNTLKHVSISMLYCNLSWCIGGIHDLHFLQMCFIHFMVVSAMKNDIITIPYIFTLDQIWPSIMSVAFLVG